MLTLLVVLPVLFAAVLGAVFASFLCVVAERVPRRLSLLGVSRCACGRALRPWENVPVLGWLATGGRARCCGAKLPAFYVLAEVAAAAAFAVTALVVPVLVGQVGLDVLWCGVLVAVGVRFLGPARAEGAGLVQGADADEAGGR